MCTIKIITRICKMVIIINLADCHPLVKGPTSCVEIEGKAITMATRRSTSTTFNYWKHCFRQTSSMESADVATAGRNRCSFSSCSKGRHRIG